MLDEEKVIGVQEVDSLSSFMGERGPEIRNSNEIIYFIIRSIRRYFFEEIQIGINLLISEDESVATVKKRFCYTNHR